MKTRQFWICLAIAAVLGLTSMGAQAQSRKVNCDVGQSLQAAINRARSSAAPLVLKVKGTCYETVRTGRDLLTIDGGNQAVIHGGIINFGARMTIRNIGITGPGDGVVASTGRTRLINVNFFDNEKAGLSIGGNGTVSFNGGSITNSGRAGVAVESGAFEASDVEISGNGSGIEASMSRITLENTDVINNTGRGIDVAENSALRVDKGSVSRNSGAGVVVDYSSSFVAEGVDISWNDSSAIAVRWNSNAEIVASTIGNNGQGGGFGSGVFVSTASSATIGSTEIFSNRTTGINANRHSFVELSDETSVRDNFEHGVRLSEDSGAIVNPEVNIPTNGSGYAVICFDDESSLENRSAGVGVTDCTGFDSP